MKALGQLYLANAQEFLSNRKALFLTIAFPVIFVVLFGLIYSNHDKVDGNVGIVDDDGGELGRQITAALTAIPKEGADPSGHMDRNAADKNPFSELVFAKTTDAVGRDDLKHGRMDAMITIPAGLTQRAATVKENYLRDAAAELQSRQAPPDADHPAGQAGPAGGQSPAHTAPPDVAHVLLTIDPTRQTLGPALQALLDRVLSGVNAGVTGQPPWVEVKTQPVQAREIRTIDYLLPGILAMSVMQIGLLATAPPLVALRVQGVLKRLRATPLARATLLTAYIALRLTIALVQTAIIVAIGRFAFQVAMVGSWWLFGGWVLLGNLTFLSIGFLMAAISSNEESCTAMANIVNLPMILLSGIFFPVNGLPFFLKAIVNLVPLNYLADALRVTMVGAPPLHDPQTNALAQAAWVVVMVALAVRFFSWDSR
jgi:ABC-2 type transport system permease protein